jgi:23S rRNA (adenine2503-C2)-methyltransferase
MSDTQKTSLIGLSRPELAGLMASLGEKPFRAKQLWQWIYGRGVTDFHAMTDIAKPLREKLAASYTLARPVPSQDQQSTDGTRKWLLRFADGKEAETVFIPEDDRGALCVSSQVGCTLTCTFCYTGTMKLVRNLTAGEIVGQWLLAADSLSEWQRKENAGSGNVDHVDDDIDVMELVEHAATQPLNHSITQPPKGRLTNIVMMGMGEPLFNYDAVAKALLILMDPDGIALSKRRITLSTSGVVPKIEQCGRELGVNLAISLHAVHDELRDVLVPLNKKYPLKELLQACKAYPAASNARRITFEYVMLKGVNDSDAEARELLRLLKDIPAKVNLIPWNPWPGAPYETSSNNRIRAFAQIVNDAGYSSPVRTPRGRDILAACGQLKSASERMKGEKVKLG